MKKAILISIRPEWVARILGGEKIFEIRKTAPKCGLPIDVYIYCTQGRTKVTLIKHAFDDKYRAGHCVGSNDNEPLNGKVIAKFTLQSLFYVFRNPPSWLDDWFASKACVTKEEMKKYANGKSVCLWKISDLEVFDEPKELSDFFSLPETYHHDHESMVDYYERKEARRLKRAPQSWSYIEVDE